MSAWSAWKRALRNVVQSETHEMYGIQSATINKVKKLIHKNTQNLA